MNYKNTPKGIYLLSLLSFISIIGILYYTFTTPLYIYIAIIITPVLIYQGLGLLKKWPGVINLSIVLSILLFVGGITQINVILFSSKPLGSVSPEMIIYILELVYFPFLYIYLRNEKVKDYFKEDA